MDNTILPREEIDRLRRREAELLIRIKRMKRRMNETHELDTLALNVKLFEEAQQELRRVQEKLTGAATE